VIQGTYLHHKEIKAAQGIKITARVMINYQILDLPVELLLCLTLLFMVSSVSLFVPFAQFTRPLPNDV